MRSNKKSMNPNKVNYRKAASLTVPDTSCTFDDATSVNFQPTSATRPPNLVAPIPKADKD